MVFGTRVIKYWVLGPSGSRDAGTTASSFMLSARALLQGSQDPEDETVMPPGTTVGASTITKIVVLYSCYIAVVSDTSNRQIQLNMTFANC